MCKNTRCCLLVLRSWNCALVGSHRERHKVHLIICSICTWLITEWMNRIAWHFHHYEKTSETKPGIMHPRIFIRCSIYLFPFCVLWKSSVMTMFQTCAAEEPPVGYFEARRVPGAELLRDALVSPAPERNRSAQCGRTIDSNRGLQSAPAHYCCISSYAFMHANQSVTRKCYLVCRMTKGLDDCRGFRSAPWRWRTTSWWPVASRENSSAR